MTLTLTDKKYCINLLSRHSNALFVYGDNMMRYGKGGQAVIRDCKNALGIAVKHAPKTEDKAYFTDADVDLFRTEVEAKFGVIRKALSEGRTVFWPLDGIGTGLANLAKRSPVCWELLCSYTRPMFQEYYPEGFDGLLVCGGREYEHEGYTHHLMSEWMRSNNRRKLIIQGKAKGADSHAKSFANDNDILMSSKAANWNKFGRGAGFIRNSEMASQMRAWRDMYGADVSVLAMPGGEGTAMMVDISRKAPNCFDVKVITTTPEAFMQASERVKPASRRPVKTVRSRFRRVASVLPSIMHGGMS